jgi:hypothetical protein
VPCSSCSTLGFRKSFPVVFQANLAGVVNEGRFLMPLRGDGKLAFFFAATHDPGVLVVRLEDIALILERMRLTVPGHEKRARPWD